MSRTGKMMKAPPRDRRMAARLAAVQVLYGMELTGRGFTPETARMGLRDFRDGRPGADPESPQMCEPDQALLEHVVMTVASRKDEIDSMLSGALTGGMVPERLEILLRAIIRAGIAELLEPKDMSARVLVGDYTTVTGAFYEDRETGLINAILDRLAHIIHPDAAAEAPPAEG